MTCGTNPKRSADGAGLLRQPGGFEGVLWIEVGPDRDRLAVPDLGHEGQGRLRFDAAGLAACARAANRDEPVSQIPERLDPRCEPRRRSRTGLRPTGVLPSWPRKTRPSPSHQRVQRRVPRDLGMEFAQQRVDISAVSRLEPALEGLHVLLRHRLLRQPRRLRGLRFASRTALRVRAMLPVADPEDSPDMGSPWRRHSLCHAPISAEHDDAPRRRHSSMSSSDLHRKSSHISTTACIASSRTASWPR